MERGDEIGAERVAGLAIPGQPERRSLSEARRRKFEVETKVGRCDGEALSAISRLDPWRSDINWSGAQRAKRVGAVIPNVTDVGPK